MAKFPFNDLHSFKDYVGFVKLCAPNQFPRRNGILSSEQWTLDLAFTGLREGLQMAVREKGDLPVFAECVSLVEKAYKAYQSGERKDGFITLGEIEELLDPIPTH